jgi:hypothetical protein
MTPQPPVRLDDLIELVRRSGAQGDPLEQLADATVLAEGLGELADHLVGHFVDQARRAGASWTDIGRSLGVSKQAAQQRFVARSVADVDDLTGGRFSRFTPRARAAVARAAAHAAEAGAAWVEPGHVLLGILDDPESLATRSLEATGVPAARLCERLARAGTGTGAAREHLPFTAGSKLLLERTLREALLLGHNYVGTEHVLLALFDDDAAAGTALREAGAERAAVRAWIIEQLLALTRPGGGTAGP